VTLSGLWVSSSPFGPRAWQFPPNSLILPEQYIKVWLDNDGSKCPDPNLESKPCFWECPDPTDAYDQEFHANFSLNAGGDQVYLFDDESHNFGLIHRVAFGPQTLNHSLSDAGRRQERDLADTPVPTSARSTAIPAGVHPRDADGTVSGDHRCVFSR
jgi:hypothetical protein